jgi:hypothetical protein
MRVRVSVHVWYECVSAYSERILDERDYKDFVLDEVLARFVSAHLRLQCRETTSVTTHTHARARAREHTGTRTRTRTRTRARTRTRTRAHTQELRYNVSGCVGIWHGGLRVQYTIELPGKKLEVPGGRRWWRGGAYSSIREGRWEAPWRASRMYLRATSELPSCNAVDVASTALELQSNEHTCMHASARLYVPH